MTAAKKETSKPEPVAKGARVVLTWEEAQKEGLFGYEVDPTPDEHYTVPGVLAGKPTPETERRS